jgi:hypothetical protein
MTFPIAFKQDAGNDWEGRNTQGSAKEEGQGPAIGGEVISKNIWQCKHHSRAEHEWNQNPKSADQQYTPRTPTHDI